ncbi:MAG TPA: twin-arginine translocase TatA/TatE family subunit [Methylomirabilota bacterium]|nr:twin-arginine translocase TatA/TatE family subunit [Methylomirabilota bacterium]
MIGSQDLMVGLVIALFFFGAKKLPELAGSIGKSMKEFKKGVSDDAEAAESSKPTDPPAVTAAASRLCESCQAPLEPSWQHCPRCGASAPSTSLPPSEHSA